MRWGEPGPPGHPLSPGVPTGEALLGGWEHLPVASVDALEEGAEQTHGNRPNEGGGGGINSHLSPLLL